MTAFKLFFYACCSCTALNSIWMECGQLERKSSIFWLAAASASSGEANSWIQFFFLFYILDVRPVQNRCRICIGFASADETQRIFAFRVRMFASRTTAYYYKRHVCFPFMVVHKQISNPSVSSQVLIRNKTTPAIFGRRCAGASWVWSPCTFLIEAETGDMRNIVFFGRIIIVFMSAVPAVDIIETVCGPSDRAMIGVRSTILIDLERTLVARHTIPSFYNLIFKVQRLLKVRQDIVCAQNKKAANLRRFMLWGR